MEVLLTRLRRLVSGLLAALALLSGAAAQEARYPSRPLRMIVPFPPGGSNDILARLVAQRLGERLGQQVVIDNRGGADGIIGTEMAAKSAPDGYTILIVSTSYTMNPALHALPYDPLKSLTGIATIATGANVIASHPNFAAANVRDLVAMARAKPGEIRYASSGVGGFNHFGGELFNSLAGVSLMHVPYKGGGPSMVDVMGGQVEVVIGTLIQALPHIRSGRLKALGVGSARRSPLLPEVPTIAESGVPGYDGSIWWGLLGPAGMPAAIVRRLNTEVGEIVREPALTRRLETEAAEALVSSPEEFGKLIAGDLAKWARIAKQAGIKAN